jgi:hypothetical protein
VVVVDEINVESVQVVLLAIHANVELLAQRLFLLESAVVVELFV